MSDKKTHPNKAYYQSESGGLPAVPSTPFVCPHSDCQVYAEHAWGITRQLVVHYPTGGVGGRNLEGTDNIVMALCTSCKQESVFVSGQLVYPLVSPAPIPLVDMPPDLVVDFEEARQILPYSPRGAAALLRLIVQKMLPAIGATKPDINSAIKELVEKGVINPQLQQALDSVRVIGNEAVHPGTMDLRDDEATALALFGLVNFIVQKAISEPKEVAAIYNSLPQNKLDAIAARDKMPGAQS